MPAVEKLASIAHPPQLPFDPQTTVPEIWAATLTTGALLLDLFSHLPLPPITGFYKSRLVL
jgi:hypothetical protein